MTDLDKAILVALPRSEAAKHLLDTLAVGVTTQKLRMYTTSHKRIRHRL